MTTVDATPLHAIQESAGAGFIGYGSPDDHVEVVDSFGAYEAEYAALRKGVGVLDMPQRGLIEVRGSDRLTFLQAMVTNDTSAESLGSASRGGGSEGGSGGGGCRAFLLNKKGRIDADLIAFEHDGVCYLDLDRCDVATVVKELDKYLFTEDAQLEDVSAKVYHLALHGPEATALVERIGSESVTGLEPGQCSQVTIDGAECRLYRRDQLAAPGYHLWTAIEAAAGIYQRIAGELGGLVPDVEGGARRDLAGRGVGWLAYNTARIEAGAPLYHIDFGPDSLPHETGVLDETVSFTKGCYLGQEIVARMHNLGHARRTLVGIKIDDERLPIAGSQVLDAQDGATVIGAVTSSTLSPLLGNCAIGFAMIKWGRHRPNTNVLIPAEGEMVRAVTQGLRFVGE